MTQVYLVRWPDRRKPPPGAFGRCEFLPPDVYAYVKDRAAFAGWCKDHGQLADCQHVPEAFEKLLKERVERDPLHPLPDGMRRGTDGQVKIRVWPVSVRNVDVVSAFVWESPAYVATPRGKSQRRGRWKRKK